MKDVKLDFEENVYLLCITEAWVDEMLLKASRRYYELAGYSTYLYQKADRIVGN